MKILSVSQSAAGMPVRIVTDNPVTAWAFGKVGGETTTPVPTTPLAAQAPGPNVHDFTAITPAGRYILMVSGTAGSACVVVNIN